MNKAQYEEVHSLTRHEPRAGIETHLPVVSCRVITPTTALAQSVASSRRHDRTCCDTTRQTNVFLTIVNVWNQYASGASRHATTRKYVSALMHNWLMHNYYVLPCYNMTLLWQNNLEEGHLIYNKLCRSVRDCPSSAFTAILRYYCIIMTCNRHLGLVTLL